VLSTYLPATEKPSVSAGSSASASEWNFYSHYDWCLNPILSLDELRLRLRQELDRYGELDVEWQREESRINIYLLACAIACTVDDYLARRRVDLTPAVKRVPRLKHYFGAIQGVADVAAGHLSRFAERSVRTWRKRWSAWVETACRLLTDPPEIAPYTISDLKSLEDLLVAKLPAVLLRRCMRVPESFRAQDMAHQDVLTLADRFHQLSPRAGRPVVIIGLRTAGAYFAPLMAVYLRKLVRNRISWFSVRPKFGASLWEARQIRKAVESKARFVVVDDYPATGRTFRLVLDILRPFEIPNQDVTIVAPSHPASPNWIAAAGVPEGMRVVTLGLDELHKARFMQPGSLQPLFSEYFGGSHNDFSRVLPDAECEAINAGLAKHYEDGHHVRLKRVVRVELCKPFERRTVRKVFMKGAGWGWLGYHAFFAATRLKGFVPPTLGLRNGLLFTDWIDHDPGSTAETRETVTAMIPAYIAARTRQLRLRNYDGKVQQDYGWNGCDDIMNILRGAYGSYAGLLKRASLSRQIAAFTTSTPSLVDGKMHFEEWVGTPGVAYKIDFAHHNFGGANLDLVDPGYDLAGAAFEFQLSRHAEREMLATYARESNDVAIGRRVLMYKLLYGSIAMKDAVRQIERRDASDRRIDEYVRRYHAARNFLVYGVMDFCAEWMGCRPATAWSKALFFMDLDGVFDRELFGFAHTSINGLRAVALLKANNFSVVLNTGRSIEDVRQYCNSYGFEGGIGEYGSVFFDAVKNRESPLIDDTAAQELARCREAIKSISGTCLDPDYRFAIRAYRLRDGRSTGLSMSNLEGTLSDGGFEQLAFICREADTVIVSKEVSKGNALDVVRRGLGCESEPVAAIGDSEMDVPMLERAQFAYAPANCHAAIRELAREGKCVILRQRFQRGLLASVRRRLGTRKHNTELLPPLPREADQPDSLILRLLDISDRPLLYQLLGRW